MKTKIISLLLGCLLLSPMAHTADATERTMAPRFSGDSKEICRIGFNTLADTLTLPLGTEVQAHVVEIPKPCKGEAIATFTAEAKVDATGVINVLARATCITCPIGLTVSAHQQWALTQNSSPGFQVYTATFTWFVLPPGRWRFEVFAQGLFGQLRNRTLVVQALRP